MLHGDRTHIIGLRIEFDESCELLKRDKAKSNQVSNQQTFSNNECRKPHKCVSDGFISCA